MRVRILFFGILKDLAGKSSDTLELPDQSTVGDVLSDCAKRFPQLEACLASLAVAVNQRYAGMETGLKSDDEVALLPPVSGGSEDRQPTGYISIVRETIDTSRLLAGIKRSDDGAVVIFEGIVRNQTRGRRTLHLDYEAYEEMARQQMEDLVQRAMQQFQVRDVALVHRVGRLNIGETSVLIAVSSAHRAAAFDACRWLIDTLKRTVPIWKKEYFEDGAIWADGEPFPAEIPRANSASRGSPALDGASK
ncbi:MAG: MoaD family protein [Candidatus Sulfotelmatobacter sp.]